MFDFLKNLPSGLLNMGATLGATVGKMLPPPPFNLLASPLMSSCHPAAAPAVKPAAPTSKSSAGETHLADSPSKLKAPLSSLLGPYLSGKPMTGSAAQGPGKSMMPPQFGLKTGVAVQGNSSLPPLLGAPAIGPSAYAGRNAAGGISAGANCGGWQWGNGAKLNLPSINAQLGLWGEKGSTRIGEKYTANSLRLQSPEDRSVVVGANGPSAFFERSIGEDGASYGQGYSLGSVDATTGGFFKEKNNDQQFKVGVGIGKALGFRLHWGDSDGDGKREWGFGATGPIPLPIPGLGGSFDIKTEDPVKTLKTLGKLALGTVNPMFALSAIPDLLNKGSKVNQTDLLIHSIQALIHGKHKQ